MIKKIISTGIAAVVSLVWLCAFVFIYGFSGVHIKNDSNATDYKWYSHQFKSTMTEGFAWNSFDSNGFNNPDTVDSNEPDILLMGSSHMEAVNVDQTENTAALVRNELPSFSIYNIGVSGHTIYQCAKNLKYAVKEYSPKKYIFIETDSINLENELMQNVIEEKLPDIPSYDSGAVFYVQRYCPAVKSIYKQLSDWRSSDIKVNIKVTNDEVDAEDDTEILMEFLQKMKEDAGTCRLVIIYHPKTAIDENGCLLKQNKDTRHFSEICEKNDIGFIDMTDSFEKLYNNEHILAHGFCNTAIGEGHLNKYGHKLIAEKISELVTEEQK